MKQAMKEMGRYLADRVQEEDQEEEWTGRRMMAYLNQGVLVQHPPNVMGVRNHRELTTLGRAIDLLLQGHLGELGDLLVQRFKAIETAMSDQSWSSARHQELIPAQAASLTTEPERKKAAQMELRQSKLRDMVAKGKKQDK